jgi:hypothetical protein
MSMDPPPPRMSLDDYADWIYANLTQSKNKAQQVLQKQIQEPPLTEPFRYIDDPAPLQVAAILVS